MFSKSFAILLSYIFLNTPPDYCFWKSCFCCSVVIDVSNVSYQKEFERFSFLRSAYVKFVEMFIETFINLFLLLQFSVPFEL